MSETKAELERLLRDLQKYVETLVKEDDKNMRRIHAKAMQDELQACLGLVLDLH